MSALGGKRGVTVKPQSAPNGDINVTPLVDVVLVLLIIFMVVTPLLEKDIQISLPTTEKMEEVKDIPPDQLIVKISADGHWELNNEPIDPAQYVNVLRGKLASRADKVVFVLADDQANYAKLVSALDGAKAAGATTLGMATDTPQAPTP
ncbi:MAG: biopolymer transporter ExbD [Labilithrix sp.]|nr:biopolymer transporter ExbD [Labilithrix sp.]